MLQDLGIGTAPFAGFGEDASLAAARAEIGGDAVLKTRRMGYDGKGQVVLRAGEPAGGVWDDLGPPGGSYVLEGFVAFRRELSIVAARDLEGRTAHYPLAENVHRDGILRSRRRYTVLAGAPFQSHLNGLANPCAFGGSAAPSCLLDASVKFLWNQYLQSMAHMSMLTCLPS
jgi:phosphoribosylaminoimidazole carboxylase (NCAIR synthetase)